MSGGGRASSLPRQRMATICAFLLLSRHLRRRTVTI
jgi:hypothetical protein